MEGATIGICPIRREEKIIESEDFTNTLLELEVYKMSLDLVITLLLHRKGLQAYTSNLPSGLS